MNEHNDGNSDKFLGATVTAVATKTKIAAVDLKKMTWTVTEIGWMASTGMEFTAVNKGHDSGVKIHADDDDDKKLGTRKTNGVGNFFASIGYIISNRQGSANLIPVATTANHHHHHHNNQVEYHENTTFKKYLHEKQ